MLPLEVHTTNDPITPEFLKDHIVLADGPNRNNAPIITLSGLRGHLIEYVTYETHFELSYQFWQRLIAHS